MDSQYTQIMYGPGGVAEQERRYHLYLMKRVKELEEGLVEIEKEIAWCNNPAQGMEEITRLIKALSNKT